MQLLSSSAQQAAQVSELRNRVRALEGPTSAAFTADVLSVTETGTTLAGAAGSAGGDAANPLDPKPGSSGLGTFMERKTLNALLSGEHELDDTSDESDVSIFTT